MTNVAEYDDEKKEEYKTYDQVLIEEITKKKCLSDNENIIVSPHNEKNSLCMNLREMYHGFFTNDIKKINNSNKMHLDKIIFKCIQYIDPKTKNVMYNAINRFDPYLKIYVNESQSIGIVKLDSFIHIFKIKILFFILNPVLDDNKKHVNIESTCSYKK